MIECANCPVCRVTPGARIHLPVEAALIKRDEVVSLLAALGAAVDIPINQHYLSRYASQSHQPIMNLLQWTSAIVENLSKVTPNKPQPTETQDLPSSPANDTWTQYRAFLDAVLPTKNTMSHVASHEYCIPLKVVAPRLDNEHVPATRDYYARAESILRSYSTVPYQTLQSSEASTVQTSGDRTFQLQGHIVPQISGYIRYINSYSTTSVPVHLKVLYDELYEACWTGDNASIQELCLPKHLSDGKEPIQISVQVTSKDPLKSTNGMLWLTAYLWPSS